MTLSAGTHTVIATYSGGAQYAGSVSNTVTQTVKSTAKAPTATVFFAPTGAAVGQTTVLSATVQPATPGGNTPGGTVTFTADLTVLLPQLRTAAAKARAVHKSSAPPAGLPAYSGSFTFKDGSTTLAVVPVLADGSATFTTTALAAGTHHITAAYGNDPNY